MSYSFSVKATTKDLALKAVRDELEKVVLAQPVHASDYMEAMDCAKSFVGLLAADDDTKDVSVSVSGYLSWNSLDSSKSIQTANISVTASLSVREVPAT